MRILIIEDDKKIASFIKKGLRESGFVVDCAYDGEEGLDMALVDPYDAAIVDLMLPKMDGLSVIEELRNQEITIPVLILSAKRSVDDRVKGLQTGGDDYLTKPFAFSELLARIMALIRRSSNTAEPTHLEYADITFNLLSREVKRGNKNINLQPKEFSLLEYFLRNPERVLSKTIILEHVYDYNFDPQTNVVDVLVCRLRDKIDRESENKMIHTIRGVGYVLKES